MSNCGTDELPIHPPLPKGEWWACERPEAKPEAFKQHYRRCCRRCLPAFLTSAMDSEGRFIFPTSDQPDKLYARNGVTIPALTEWFMRGERESSLR